MPYAPKPKAKPAKIKVSQATIDKIKTMGMTAALKKAGTSKNAEYIEGIRRMYGARRLAKAQSTSKPVIKTADQARAGGMSRTKVSTPKAPSTTREQVRMSRTDRRPKLPKPAPTVKKTTTVRRDIGITRGYYRGD